MNKETSLLDWPMRKFSALYPTETEAAWPTWLEPWG